MKIHYLQHVPFEDPAYILKWALRKGHRVGCSRLFENEPLPRLPEFDLLIVMGGPMNIYEDEKYPWLAPEKRLIKAALQNGKFVLGICLGAQLIADVAGSRVIPGKHKEIGWFPVRLSPAAAGHPLLADCPQEFTAFHWHGDTFGHPPQAIPMGSSSACENQGFILEGKAVALQFHLESTLESVLRLIENCGNELVDGKWIQDRSEILQIAEKHVKKNNNIIAGFLDKLQGTICK